MKQTLLHFVALLTALVASVSAFATTILVDGIYYEIDYPKGGEAPWPAARVRPPRALAP